MTLVWIFLVLQTALCIGLLCNALVNLRFLNGVRPRRRADDELPFVSVCVPARNEARNIRECIESLAAQDYPSYEVLVLDDCSDDGTADVVEPIAARHKHVRLMRGRDLPEGWLGKSYACHQMSQVARGEYVLFTDADTVFAPGCLRHAAQTAIEKRGDLTTGVPRLLARTWPERLSVPLLTSIAGSVAPLPLLEDRRFKFIAAGSGAFLFFKRKAYDAIGGHASVRGHIVEDLQLTRRMKMSGRHLAACDVSRFVRCRMYQSFAEVWEGFSKNVFPGAEMNWAAFAGMVGFILTAWFLPWVWFAFGSAWGWGPWLGTVLPLVQITAVSLARTVTDAKLGQPDTAGVVALPVAAILVVIIGMNSASRAMFRKPTPWRGREYALYDTEAMRPDSGSQASDSGK